MKKQLLLIVFLIFGTFASTFAQNNWKAEYSKRKVFIENQGQFDHFETEKTGKIEYGIDFGNTKIFFSKTGVSYLLTELERLQKSERTALKQEAVASASVEEYKKIEKELRKYNLKSDLVVLNWENSSAKTELEGINKTIDYHSYSFTNTKTKQLENINFIPGYEKIVYKNIYPKIDIEYTVHPVIGVKYAFTIHPGANPTDIRLIYNESAQLLDGKIQIPTIFGNITDHAPITFYENNNSAIIESKFVQQGATFSFKLGNYDTNKTIIIDPWTQTPAFATNWDCIWELDTDAAGNVYIIGGVMPMQLLKYNPAGVLQWTHNTPYDSTGWLGTMGTDDLGNTYITNGVDYRIQKVSTAGALLWNNNAPANAGGISTEFWNIAFNCDQTKLIVGGSGGNLDIHGRIYDVNMNNGNVISSVQVTSAGALIGIPPAIQEVRAMCNAPNGKYYFVTLDTIGYMNDDLTLCGPSNSSLVRANHGVAWGYKSENFRYNNTGIKVLRADENFVYVHRGNILQKRSLQDFSIIGTVNIPGGNLQAPFLGGNQNHNAGIDIDDCGNIYVGSTNGVYKFSPALVQLASFPTAFVVYDVRVSTNGDVVACGGTGNSGSASRSGGVQSFAAAACAPIEIVCCDATICLPETFCSNDAPVSLTVATPGGTWSGTGVNASGVFNPATAGTGTHDITYTLPCGSETITITVSPCASLSVCEETNGTLTVSNGVGPYNWQTQTTTQDCSACFVGCTIPPGCAVNATTWTTYATGTNAAAPATFPAQVVDGTGTIFTITSLAAIPDCSATPPCPTITVTSSAQTNITCAGETNGAATVSASGGTAPYTYSWTPGNLIGATQTALAAGTYTVTATDNNQCTGTTTVTITAPTAITATSTTTPASCGATNGSATVTPAGGTGPFTYSWSPSGGSAASASGLAGGSYAVTITDANLCTFVHNLTISTSGGATATISNSTNASCANTTNGSATVSVTGGATPYTYAWSPSGGSAATASNLAPGNYTVTVTDANQCVSTATVTITAPPAITATSSTTPASCGVADGSATVVVQGGSGTFTYAWSPSGGTNATASSLTSGPYTVTITDGNQCSITQNLNVPSNGGPTITIANVSNVSCAGLADGTATAQLTGGTAPFTYQWSPSGGSNATASNLGSGTYTVTVTDGSGCIVSETVTISNPTAITIIETITDENCGASDGAISTTVTGGAGNYTYNWSPGGETTASLTNVEFGDYTLIVTDANGCTATETYTIEQIGGLTISVSPTNTTIEQGDSVQLVASGATTYTWIPSDGLSCDDCPNPFASPIETTTYTVIGEDANGCSGSTEVTVFLQPICGQVFVPTIFSPNGDGNNDFVCVNGNCILELDFSIYNRWGEVVFTTTDSTICWDGTHKGKPVNSGTFVYKMYVRLIDGTTKTEAGNISVVK